MVYVVSERPAVGLSGPMVDPGGLGSEDTANSRLALYCHSADARALAEVKKKLRKSSVKEKKMILSIFDV